MTLIRCPWPGQDPLYLAYHDDEWGVPEWDDRALFEKLTLDSFQAGLSWITILRKREGFRAAFERFDPELVARFDAQKITALLNDPNIVRHRGKIDATIGNAQAYLRLMEEGGFANYLWQFVDHRPIQNCWQSLSDVPAATDLSKTISIDLKKRGFRFVGPTIIYAFMQAVGIVNDHLESCFRHKGCAALAHKPHHINI